MPRPSSSPVPRSSQSGDTAEAMSQENVEIVRRLYSLAPDAAAVVRGDYDEVFLDYFHPDFELVPPTAYPDTESSYRARKGRAVGSGRWTKSGTTGVPSPSASSTRALRLSHSSACRVPPSRAERRSRSRPRTS